MITATRVYRGRKLHLAEGPPTGPDNPPVMQERTTLCGLKLSGRWFEVMDRRYHVHPFCPKCTACRAEMGLGREGKE